MSAAGSETAKKNFVVGTYRSSVFVRAKAIVAVTRVLGSKVDTLGISVSTLSTGSNSKQSDHRAFARWSSSSRKLELSAAHPSGDVHLLSAWSS